MKKQWKKFDLTLLVLVSFLIGFLVGIGFFLAFFIAQQDDNRPFRITFDIGEKSTQKEVMPEPPETYTSIDNQQLDPALPYSLWETTTVLRNALYQYVRHNGKMPSDLAILTEAYPQNYLSSIPKNPLNNSNEVSETGGWIYHPHDVNKNSPRELSQAVQQAIVPTGYVEKEIPFEALQITIDRKQHSLVLASGGKVIDKYPVALGKDGKTPSGTFYIEKRIANPNESHYEPGENPYGTRALALSNPSYAIHGTNHPEQIGEDVSNGCIRMKNEDMESLFPKVSLYTPVKITEQNSIDFVQVNSGEQQTKALYNQKANPNEETAAFFGWAG